MAKLKVDNLSNEIAKALRTYVNGVTVDLEKAKVEVAKNTVAELKQTSPEGKMKTYKKGWRVKKVGNAQVVHNATDYQLTHLLEHGHAKLNGGRTRKFIHIKPAEEKAIKEYVDKVEKVIREWSI